MKHLDPPVPVLVDHVGAIANHKLKQAGHDSKGAPYEQVF